MTLSEALAGAGLHLISATPVELESRIWICVGFEEADRNLGDQMHLAFLHAGTDWLHAGDLHRSIVETFAGVESVLTRIHSECLLGDAFGSTMCDCGHQMRLALAEIVARGSGAFLYLRQEGRGIGMRSKLDVLALQYGFADGLRSREPLTSDAANLAMGFPVDGRSFAVAGAFLRALRIASVDLITGNRGKIADLEAEGISVAAVLDLWVGHVGARATAELSEKIARGYLYQR